jgi:uncharacterized protein involved in exopolysaccharide biosynthesis
MDGYVGPGGRGELDLISFMSMVWRHRRVVGIACVVSILAAIAYLMIATPMYRAEVVLVPAEEDNMSGSSSVGDKLGGLASLAGLNLGQETPDEMTADAVLDSRALAEEFVRRNNLVPMLLKNFKRQTLWHAVSVFKLTLLKVKKDQNKGTTKVSVEWSDPVTAARWANGLVALCNEMMRTHVRDDASRNIAYLDHQLQGTSDVELRKDFSDILENEMRRLMLANGREEYAFQVVDPAVPPESRAHPQKVLVLLLGVALGLAVGCMIAFVREQLAERRRAAAFEEAAAADLVSRRERRSAGDSAVTLAGKN